MLSMIFLTQFLGILIPERIPIIHDNRKGNTILEYDVVQDILHNFLTDDVCHRNGFNPLHKIFNCSNDEFMAIRRIKVNLSYKVKSPLREGP